MELEELGGIYKAFKSIDKKHRRQQNDFRRKQIVKVPHKVLQSRIMHDAYVITFVLLTYTRVFQATDAYI